MSDNSFKRYNFKTVWVGRRGGGVKEYFHHMQIQFFHLLLFQNCDRRSVGLKF